MNSGLEARPAMEIRLANQRSVLQVIDQSEKSAINHDENMSVVTITAIIGRIKFMFSIKVWPIEIRKGAAIY